MNGLLAVKPEREGINVQADGRSCATLQIERDPRGNHLRIGMMELPLLLEAPGTGSPPGTSLPVMRSHLKTVVLVALDKVL